MRNRLPAARLYYTPDADIDPYLPALSESRFEPISIQSVAWERIVGDDAPKIFIVGRKNLLEYHQDLARLLIERKERDVLLIRVVNSDWIEDSREDELIYDYLIKPFHKEQVLRLISNAASHVRLRIQTAYTESELNQRRKELTELTRIGIALSAERDHHRLLNMILEKSREITSADSGTLYLIENGDTLRFKLSQSSSMENSYTEFTMPMSEKSISGYAALTGNVVNLEDCYYLAKDSEFGFDRSWDKRSGYRTKSMLVVPMRDHKNSVIGVIQLINKKSLQSIILTSTEMTEKRVVPFDKNDEALASSLASQAAVSIENNLLYESIQTLFEGFVQASVTAVESRDPTTSGHSERVAILTTELADAVQRSNHARFKNVRFSSYQMKELRYACLLHDFGKVSVRENVLLKAKKLYPYDLNIVKQRFEFVKLALRLEFEQKKSMLLQSENCDKCEEKFASLQEDTERQSAQLDEYLDFIIKANEPTVMEQGGFEKLKEIAQYYYNDFSKKRRPILTEREVKSLSIRKGSIDDEEREEVNSHVIHSQIFLSKIPWTDELKNIPEIAYGHHEKLNGSGYPNKLTAERILLQTRMMTIADIYDALSAKDRPYKSSMDTGKALNILKLMVKDGELDAGLVRLFIDEKIYERTKSPT